MKVKLKCGKRKAEMDEPGQRTEGGARVRIALGDILPTKQGTDPQDNIKRYRAICASIKEVGMIEPLVVCPQKGAAGKYLLVDGHLRHFALQDLGEEVAECIITGREW